MVAGAGANGTRPAGRTRATPFCRLRVSFSFPTAERAAGATAQMTLREFQDLIRAMYHDKDASRGVEGTFMWLTEEIGELATALRSGTHDEQALEFADVLAWLVTIANVVGVDLDDAVRRKYGTGCPGCGQFVCTCPDAEKP